MGLGFDEAVVDHERLELARLVVAREGELVVLGDLVRGTGRGGVRARG